MGVHDMSTLDVSILRFARSSTSGIFGILSIENCPFCMTKELLWRGNVKDVSCIPDGDYECKKYFSPHFKYLLYKLIDVPGRGDVELHIGNWLKDTTGCILLGRSFYYDKEKKEMMLTESKDTFSRFMTFMNGADSFALSIMTVINRGLVNIVQNGEGK